MCAGLALAWSHEHARAIVFQRAADCYRRATEEDRVPQDRECLGP